MSAVQSESTLLSKLENLQCHFTWDLKSSRSKLLNLKERLLDAIRGGNVWLGPIYNLLGFIHHQLGLNEEAHDFFTRAAKVYPEKDPSRVVTYGNLAWLHHHQNEEEESQRFVEMVDQLLMENPPPAQDELHPEVYAEKWRTLTKLQINSPLAIDDFQRAIKMRPDRNEWRTSYLLSLNNPDLKELQDALIKDPDNLFLAAVVLKQRKENGENVEEEVEELTKRIMENNCYKGFKPLLELHEKVYSVERAIDLGEEAMKNFPEERYIKMCASQYYMRKIVLNKPDILEPDLIQRALALHRDLVVLYPERLMIKINLASVLSKSENGQEEAEQMYQDLLKQDLDPLDQQMLYHFYAKYLYFTKKQSNRSLEFQMKAAEIPEQSWCREQSIKTLKTNRGKPYVEEFLRKWNIEDDENCLQEIQEEDPRVLPTGEQ